MIGQVRKASNMANYLKVMRFSNTGFEPQIQRYHLEGIVWYHMGDGYDKSMKKLKSKISINKSELNRINYYHSKRVEFFRKHYADLGVGIWVFKDKYMHKQSLNHLNEPIDSIQKWVGELPEDIEVYDVNWEQVMTLREALKSPFGCYVPKRSLKHLRNVKRLR